MTISVCSWHFTLSYYYATQRHKALTNKQLLRLSFPVLSTIDVYKEDANNVLAYFSLANDRISLTDFENKTKFNRFRKRRFVNEKRLKSYPAVKICRLGVSEECKGAGVGTGLLNFIKKLFLATNKTGCRFLTVDAYYEAIPFYIRNGFIPLEEEDKDEHTRLLFYDLKDE